MKMNCLFGALSVIAALTSGGICATEAGKPQTPDDDDRLLPFTRFFSEDLRPVLEKKLLVTSANYGRMIRMHGPPDVGDSAVSVYCEEGGADATRCQVTLTKAKKNLDYVFAQNREQKDPLRSVNEVQIIRKDADIPKTTATAFRNCLRAMIPEDGDHRLRPPTISDDDRIEFWLAESNAIPRKGERSEHPGNRIKTLVSIGDLLAQYCETPRRQREVIVKKIEEEAARVCH
jgi:hypothetical protein